MTEHFIEVEGVRLHVVEDACAGEPEGRSVLVLHGFTGDAESMSTASNALRHRHRILRLELVGHGRSEAPTSLGFYSMPACARQIRAVVDALRLERPHLLGYSMGGRAALAAAVAKPDQFSSLVLIGATAGIVDPASRAERIRADEALADRIESQGLESFVEYWMSLPIFASQAGLGDDFLARARAQRLRNSPLGLANSLRGMGVGVQRPLHGELRSLQLPTLLIVGDEDDKFKAIAANLESVLPHARVEVLRRAGHAVHLEAPVDFGRVVAEFLDESSLQNGSPSSDPARASIRESRSLA